MEDENLEITSTFDRICGIFNTYSKLVCEVIGDNLYRVQLRMNDSFGDNTDTVFTLAYGHNNLMSLKKKIILDDFSDLSYQFMPLPRVCWYWYSNKILAAGYIIRQNIGNELRYSDASRILAGLKECKTLAEINLELDMMGV